MSRKMNKPSRTGKAFRVVALLTAIMMGVQASANGLMAAFVTVKEILQQKRYPGPFTEAPGPVFYGAHPSRDPIYRGGRWTDRTLRDLAAIEARKLREAYGGGELLSTPLMGFYGIGLSTNLVTMLQGGDEGGGGSGGSGSSEGYSGGGGPAGFPGAQGTSGGGGSNGSTTGGQGEMIVFTLVSLETLRNGTLSLTGPSACCLM